MADKLETVCAHCGGVNRVPREKLSHPDEARKAKCGKCGSALLAGAPEAVTQAAFDRFIGRSDIPVLVDFWAPWCGPCRTLGPILERAAVQLAPQIRVAKLNIDEAQAVAGRLRVTAVPTLAVFRNGQELARTSGVMAESALTDWARRAAGVTA